jgi:ribosomal protein S18 acetylase RimI-like enzyme
MKPAGVFEIRAMRAQDFDAWLPLWIGYQRFYGIELSDAVTQATWARLLDSKEPVCGAIAREGSEQRAAGLAHWLYHRSTWSVQDDCYLNDLFVDPMRRRQGLARELIKHATEAARAAGCGQIYWLTHQTNETAIALYEKLAERTGFLDFRIRL